MSEKEYLSESKLNLNLHTVKSARTTARNIANDTQKFINNYLI